MPRVAAYALLALFMTQAARAADPPPARFPIAIKNHWGYIDAAGTTAIEPHFHAAADFSEDLAAVRILDDVGYIDTAGNVAIAPRFVAADPFSENLAAVLVDDPNSLTENPYGFIDTTGKLVIPATLAR